MFLGLWTKSRGKWTSCSHRLYSEIVWSSYSGENFWNLYHTFLLLGDWTVFKDLLLRVLISWKPCKLVRFETVVSCVSHHGEGVCSTGGYLIHRCHCGSPSKDLLTGTPFQSYMTHKGLWLTGMRCDHLEVKKPQGVHCTLHTGCWSRVAISTDFHGRFSAPSSPVHSCWLPSVAYPSIK